MEIWAHGGEITSDNKIVHHHIPTTPGPTVSLLSTSDETTEIDIDFTTTTSTPFEDVDLEPSSSTFATTLASLVPGSEEDNLSEEISFAEKISGDESDDLFDAIRVPRYFQAIFTLLVCALLLFITLGIIQQTRRLCKKSSCTSKLSLPLIRVNSGKDDDDMECDSVVVTNGGKTPKKNNVEKGNGEADMRPGDRHFDYYTPNTATPTPTAPTAPNGSTDSANDNDLLKLKKVRFVRKNSGPFGEDAIDFARQTYKTKEHYKESSIHAPKKPFDPANPRNQSIRKPQLPPPRPPTQ